MNNIKIESIERITFSLSSDLLPFDIINDVEKFVGVKNCVIQLYSYIGSNYVVAICSTDAVKTLMANNRMQIGRKMCSYQFCEKTIKRLRILQPPPHMKSMTIDKCMRPYGKVLYSEIEKRSNGQHCYFAVIDAQKQIPEKISLKRKMYDVTCF